MTDKDVEEVTLDKKTASGNPGLANRLAEAEERKSTKGLILGAVCLVLGVILIFAGIEGSVDWTFRIVGGVESKLAKASPGIVLCVIGLLVIWLTRFRFVVK